MTPHRIECANDNDSASLGTPNVEHAASPFELSSTDPVICRMHMESSIDERISLIFGLRVINSQIQRASFRSNGQNDRTLSDLPILK